MKTEVIMKRPFMGSEVSQRSKSGFFSATDLVNIVNIKRRELGKPIFNLSAFLKNKSTQSFIEELQKENNRVLVKGNARKSPTWVHPLLFIDIALAASPKLKVQVYQWLYDELLKNRNNSGESYKKMCGALYDRTTDKTKFHKNITKLAKLIKNKINVEDWNKATEDQLKLRDKIHEDIYLLCEVLNNPNQAIRISIERNIKTKEL